MEIMTAMKNIIESIEEVINLPDNIDDEIMNPLVENFISKVEKVENSKENVNKIAENLTESKIYQNYDILSEKRNNFENIQNTLNSFENDYEREFVHSENISNIANYSDISGQNVDNSNNFGDKNSFLTDNNRFFNRKSEIIHNDSDFKEINNFIEGIADKKESSSPPSPNININMGGITQNITDANCNSVLEELSQVLMRTLSGCEGVY